MDNRYGSDQIDPTEWDNVEDKIKAIKDISLGDAIAWAVAGIFVIVGAWQMTNPICRVPPERGSAA